MVNWKLAEHSVHNPLELYLLHPGIILIHLLLTKTKPFAHYWH